MVIGAVAACGAGSSEEAPTTEQDPGAAFRSLEERLLAARSVEVQYRVEAEGAVTVTLEGALRVGPETVELTGTGQFAGADVDLSLTATGEDYTYGNGPESTTAPLPPELREALFIGFTRMGILHNLARLSANAPPDHADGGVEDWLAASAFGPHPTEPDGMRFDLTVSGEPSGSVTLALDGEGIPTVRTQVVAFPDGEMRVTETYRRVRITP